MKTGCNWLQDSSCIDGQSPIMTNLGFRTLSRLVAHSEERKHDGVDLQNVDRFRNSFLIQRLVPIRYIAGF